MDLLSIIGIALALGSILGGNMLEGGHIGSLLQFTAFVIVIGGTTGATMLQTPLPIFVRALKMAAWILFPPRQTPEQSIEKIVSWSNIARKEGLLGLENMAETEDDLFARKGLQLLVDGSEPDAIRGILEVELSAKEHTALQSAKVFEAMGGYSPTIGIIGAVMGLIHVMQNLADPGKLGEGIAVAFVATIYGVGSANLFLLPISNKLKGLVQKEAQFREMVIEGIIAIAEGENPRNIETKLQGYLH
ncbi:chemotaxis protein PomA [bacterium BMS3Bbin12]|nr:chemotaxis protein PomA [bacterium BMS3Abin12]GBE47787.1 chemotaxis protein PomA [bacterium BMS3Bbin12]GBE49897.1 chemotaxis protein PomA [bacterium BMS3Bbin13]HDJ86761.1 flagellar motor protein [Chromatiales bacterium]HDK03382.1 flagellar motor protein [Gammaproteobacteria bacterium]